MPEKYRELPEDSGNAVERPLRLVLVMIEAPIPFGHAASRWFYVLLRGLVARGHQVTAFAACGKNEEMEEARALFPSPRYDLRLYPIPEPAGFGARLASLRRPGSYLFSSELKQDLAAELEAGYDVLHLEHIWCGWLGLAHARHAVLSVLSLYRIDLAEAPPQSYLKSIRRRRLLQAERRLAAAFPRLMTLSDRLRDGLSRLNPTAEVSVVPLGIDASLYTYIPDAARTSEPIVGLIGSMNWYPSVSAARRLLTRLWPAVKSRMPAARLQIVGWGARAALKDYLNSPDVTIEEDVPYIRPYFERMAVLLYAPGRGSGIKVKVLEAMLYGVPVVTTSEGVEGLPALDGIHAGVCDDDAGLIGRTVALLSDLTAQNRQRAAARRVIESHCGPGPTVDAVERLHRRVVAKDSR